MTKLHELVSPLQGHAFRAPGHVQRRWHENCQTHGQTTGEKRLVLEMSRSHKTNEALGELLPARLSAQVQHLHQTTDDEGLRIRCKHALTRAAKHKHRGAHRDGFATRETAAGETRWADK